MIEPQAVVGKASDGVFYVGFVWHDVISQPTSCSVAVLTTPSVGWIDRQLVVLLRAAKAVGWCIFGGGRSAL